MEFNNYRPFDEKSYLVLTYDTIVSNENMNARNHIDPTNISNVIRGSYKGLPDFIRLWSQEVIKYEVHDRVMHKVCPYIPIDIFMQDTVPIKAMRIECDMGSDNVIHADVYIGSCTAVPDKLKCDTDIVLIGFIEVFDPSDLIFPIMLTRAGAIVMPYYIYGNTDNWGMDKLPDLTLEEIENIGTAHSNAHTLFSIWYGIQISISHPATEMILEHKFMKRVPIVPSDPKSDDIRIFGTNLPKYIGVCIIPDGSSVLNIITPDFMPNCKYRRLLWYVRGHYRTNQGRQIFVNSHWRGPLKYFRRKSYIKSPIVNIKEYMEGMLE